MRLKKSLIVAGGLCVALGAGVFASHDDRFAPVSDQPAAAQPKSEASKDEAAIRKSSRDFSKACEVGDAKAAAAFWSTNGEYHEESGEILRGRGEIEKAFAAFFKEKPKTKVDVQIRSIRFPSRDCAVEEGLLRQTSSGKDLPTSTLYSVIHIRENGQWKMAIAREWGAGQDRLEDLEWLVGIWQARSKDREMNLTFNHDKKRPYLVGSFTTKAKGKVVASGTMKIGLDPQRGQLRSWHFEDDGGHGQAVWIRDGNRWVLDAVGVMANGEETAGLNILARINHDAFTWRSIDRVVGAEPLLDTAPIKLTRVGEIGRSAKTEK